MTRSVIPIAPHQRQAAEAEAATTPRSILIGITVILLHLASIGFAISYF